jgi:hypothetical protein
MGEGTGTGAVEAPEASNISSAWLTGKQQIIPAKETGPPREGSLAQGRWQQHAATQAVLWKTTLVMSKDLVLLGCGEGLTFGASSCCGTVEW